MKGQFFAKKTACQSGHTHASKAEAMRCNNLRLRERAGEITALRTEPRFYFNVNGVDIKMRNGHVLRYTGDFTYIEGNRQIVEEVKARNGFMTRDVPIKLALMAVLFPDVEVRVVT